jgi:hypothetical protein
LKIHISIPTQPKIGLQTQNEVDTSLYNLWLYIHRQTHLNMKLVQRPLSNIYLNRFYSYNRSWSMWFIGMN